MIGYPAESSITHSTKQNRGESRGVSQLTFQKQLQNEEPKLGNQKAKRKDGLPRHMQTGFVLFTEKPASLFL